MPFVPSQFKNKRIAELTAVFVQWTDTDEMRLLHFLKYTGGGSSQTLTVHYFRVFDFIIFFSTLLF